tara:strand:+ start:2146 stop:2721 length:576 start_codon:yes stop_codon:yes gene_type:complete
MTVRAHKPEFNFREKITELSGPIPEHRMPGGTIVQQKFGFAPESGGTENETTSTSFVDTAHYYIDITPKFPDSSMFIEFWFNVKNNQMHGAYQYLRVVRKYPGQTGYMANTSGEDATYFWGTAGDSNHIAYQGVSIATLDSPTTTETIRYQVQQKSSTSSVTMRVGENGQNKRMMGRITEIRKGAYMGDVN